MKTEHIELEMLVANKANPRQISEAKFNKLVTSLLVLPGMMQLRPIVTDASLTILGGNMRFRALTAIAQMEPGELRRRLESSKDFTQKPQDERNRLIDYWMQWRDNPVAEVVRADMLTDAEKREFIIKDNVGYGDWDMDALANEWDIDELKDWGLDDLGFSDDSDGNEIMDDAFSEEDEQNVEKKVNPGEIWILGEHRLACGDSTDGAVLERIMEGDMADLLVTDPPYNVGYEGGAYKKRHGIANDDMEKEEFVGFLTSAISVAASVMRTGAAFYVWCASMQLHNCIEAVVKTDLMWKQLLIWKKNHITLGKQDYQWLHEPCLYGWKAGGTHWFTDDRTKKTVLEYDKPLRNALHPTMKPIPLIAELISNSSRPGETVLDVFGGSGTTLLASEQLGRKCRMVELDPHYCDVIIARWESLTGEKAVKADDVETENQKPEL